MERTAGICYEKRGIGEVFRYWLWSPEVATQNFHWNLQESPELLTPSMRPSLCWIAEVILNHFADFPRYLRTQRCCWKKFPIARKYFLAGSTFRPALLQT